MYHRFPCRQLLVNFSRHFCCRMYHLWLAYMCIRFCFYFLKFYRTFRQAISHTTQRKNTNRRNFTVWNTALCQSKTQVAHCTTSDTVCTAKEITSAVNERCKQTASSTIDLLCDSSALVISFRQSVMILFVHFALKYVKKY